jgi:hypothetical protein
MHIQSIPRLMRGREQRIKMLMSLRRKVATAAAMAPIIAILFGHTAMAAKTVLNFEDIPAPATITTQYASRGALFQQAYLDKDPAAHSGTQVLRSVSPNVEIFTSQPFVIGFTSPQARVKLFAGSQFATLNGTLRGFDSGGNVVATDGPRSVPQNTFTTIFEVKAVPAKIVRVEFQLDGTAFESIDDLEFEGEQPSPPPNQPPVVKITSPPNGLDTDVSAFDIAGTITGDGLISPVKLTVTWLRPPEQSTAPPFKSDLTLTGTGTIRQFSLPGGFSNAPLGPITVTITAENTGALKGTASNTFTNLPLAIQNRFTAEGGAAVLGAFRFGVVASATATATPTPRPTFCKVAVYEKSAISLEGAGVTRLIRGDIFTKWLSLRGAFNGQGMGCPSNEEGDALAGARVQDFERGRIYAKLPPVVSSHPFEGERINARLSGIPLSTTAYVPAVFVDAIKKRGGETDVGLPIADPTDSAGPMQTWLFQRFFRPNEPNLIPSTLEIVGSPRRLWMERQAGTWLESDDENKKGILSNTFQQTPFEVATHKSGATLWESFNCNGNHLGPCTEGPESRDGGLLKDSNFPPPNIHNAGDLFCGGHTLKYTLATGILDGPPEWQNIRGDYVATPVFGVIVSAFMDPIDNGLTHETHNDNCPYLGDDLLLAIGADLPQTGLVLGEYLASELYGLDCSSDYEFFVRPIGPQINTSPLPSLFGISNTLNIKTEYEEAYAAAAHNFLGAPAVGDLVHMTGRWIIDCGHPSYKSELHPLFSFARMKTVISETNAFTGLEDDLFGGKPATRVAIWINGWYPGGENNAIEFDAFPPPRPSPNMVLHVVKPVDSAAGRYRAAEDVNVEFAFAPAGAPNHVHLRFTSPRRENPVTRLGEMMFLPGRQYWGIWYLYWGE